jgi:hypothetical protein
MGGYVRHIQDLSSAQKPSSPASSIADAPSPARVTLPSDLSASLKYLDDAQLARLLEAVTVEINRRNQGASKSETALPPRPVTSSGDQSAAYRNNKTREIDQIPQAKANLIRESFKAGFKPAAIARTFRISRSLVNRILSSIEKPKR